MSIHLLLIEEEKPKESAKYLKNVFKNLLSKAKKCVIISSVLTNPNTEGYRSGHNEAVLKTVWAHAHKGSNPFPSAIKKQYP